ncbi:hypothetical protein KJ865_14580, partial [Myxococcota bacterium]|nr:hypothetical protein [Myxococcota bacterium]
TLHRVESEKLKSFISQNRSVIVTGENGIGKRSFIDEFFENYGQDIPPKIVFEIESNCEGDPFLKLRLHLQSIIGVDFLNHILSSVSDPMTGYVRTLFNLLDNHFVPSSPESWKLEVTAAFKAIARRFMEDNPHVLVIHGLETAKDFSDIYWSVITKLYGFHSATPVIVITALTSYKLENSAWGRIELHGIPVEQLLALSERVLNCSVPEWFEEGLARIGGNPFYHMQMLDLFLEESLPESFANRNELLEVRINQLPVRARELLQILGISESGLSLDMIAQLLGVGVSDLKPSVEICRTKGIIITRDKIVRLEHPIWKEVIEANLPAGIRRDFYKKFLQYDALGVMSLSYPQKGYFAEEINRYDIAMEAWERIGESALKYGDRVKAALYLGRSFAAARRFWMINPGMDDEESEYIVAIAVKLAFVMRDEGNIQPAIAMIQDLTELVQSSTSSLSRLLITIAQLYFSEAIYSKTELYLERYFDLANTSLDQLSVDAYKLFLELYSVKGENHKAYDVISHYLFHVKRENWHWSFFHAVGEFFFFLGEKDNAKKWWVLGGLLENSQLGNNLVCEEQLYRYYMESGDYSRAASYLEAQLMEYENRRDFLGQGNILMRLAQLALQREMVDDAKSMFRRTLGIARDLEWQDGIAMSQYFLPEE